MANTIRHMAPISQHMATAGRSMATVGRLVYLRPAQGRVISEDKSCLTRPKAIAPTPLAVCSRLPLLLTP